MDDHAVIKMLILEYLYLFVCYHLKIRRFIIIILILM